MALMSGSGCLFEGGGFDTISEVEGDVVALTQPAAISSLLEGRCGAK